MFETLRQDLPYALRQLRKTPGFTLIAVLTLALGIGANTAVFSVMNAVLLRSLPVRDPQGLYYVHMANDQGQPDGSDNTGSSNTSFSMPVFSALRERHDIFSDLIAYVPVDFAQTNVRVGRTPFLAEGYQVSGNYFSGLTAGILKGRQLAAADEQQHAPVIVLSYAFWTRAFARNAHVLGSTMYVKGVPFTVVGVAARGFIGVEPDRAVDFWIPLQNNPALNAWGVSPAYNSLYGTPRWWCLPLMARLAPGVTPAQAQSALAGTFLQAAKIGLTSRSLGDWKPLLAFQKAQGIQGYRQEYKGPIMILMGLVLLILLIAVTNVTLMIGARNTTRAREFSLRLSLGADRSRLFAQLMAESLVLVLAGTSLGWLFAVEATHWLAGIAQIDGGLSPNRPVLLFTLGVSAVAALVFGLAPMRAATTSPMAEVLRSGGIQSTTNRRAVVTGNVTIAGQIALCLVLLMAGSLLLRTLYRYQNQPLGMDAEHVLVFGIAPHHGGSPEQSLTFYRTLLDRLRALPGVQGASMAAMRPGSGWSNNGDFALNGVRQQGLTLRQNMLGSGYFQAVGTSILEGREFTDADIPTSAKVVIVNHTFAEKLLPHRSPLGQQVQSNGVTATIIGVVADSRYISASEDPMMMAYYPIAQERAIDEEQVMVRTAGDAATLLPEVRDAVGRLDPMLPLENPMTQAQQFELSYAQPTMFATMGGFFGALATLLVATGLYGTLAYRTGRRTHEIGIRMALGAQRWQVTWLVLRESLLLATMGLLAGAPLLLLCAHVMGAMLWKLSATDPVSIAIAVTGVLLVMAAASVLPARRAASVDPMQALRSE